MTLKFMQKYLGGGLIIPPLCDIECSNRAVGLWQDEDGKAFDLCRNHSIELQAEEIVAGAWYPSTNLPLPGWSYLQGKYVEHTPKR